MRFHIYVCVPKGNATYKLKNIKQTDYMTQQQLRERSLIIGGGGPVNLGGGPGFFGLPFGEGHMFLSLR